MNTDNNNSSQEEFKIQKKENLNYNITENKGNELNSINNNNNNIMIERDINNRRNDFLTYIMNHRKKMYHRLEGMEPEDAEEEEDPEEKEEPEEDSSSHHEQINLNNTKKPHYGNIGSNIVLFNRWVIGIKKNLIFFIITLIGMALTWFGWILTCDNYYSKKLYIICSVSFFFTNFFMILSFIIEPGIIPRKCPEFSKINVYNDKEKKTNNDMNINNDDNDAGKENKIKEEKNIDENKEIKEKKLNGKIKEKNNEEIIPRIFRERECVTCNIIRPPGASHCRICDNCVMGFDHHCYYISNCVGKRNHKYFYFFLFFGTISGIEECFFISITLFHVFIIKANETIFIMYKSDKFFFILSSILMSIALIYLYCGVRDILCLMIPALIGFVIFLILWYKHIYILDNIPNYYNPYILLVFISAVSFFLFVLSTFIGQTTHICSGYTIKQTRSIINELIDLSYGDNNHKINIEYTRNKPFKEKIKNLFKFLKSDVEKSLIIPERDLFYYYH